MSASSAKSIQQRVKKISQGNKRRLHRNLADLQFLLRIGFMARLKVTAYLQFLGRLLPRIVLRPEFDKYLDFLVEVGIEQEEQQYTSEKRRPVTLVFVIYLT